MHVHHMLDSNVGDLISFSFSFLTCNPVMDPQAFALYLNFAQYANLCFYVRVSCFGNISLLLLLKRHSVEFCLVVVVFFVFFFFFLVGFVLSLGFFYFIF